MQTQDPLIVVCIDTIAMLAQVKPQPFRSTGVGMMVFPKKAKAIFTALLLLCFVKSEGAEVIPPAPKNYFNDYANVVKSATATRLNESLADFERRTSNQFVVAIFPKLQSDSSLDDYTLRVCNSWGVGQREKNNGVVLFLFIQDRAMRLHVGSGLEIKLPNALCKQILDEQIRSKLREGDFDGGVNAGVKAIIAAIEGTSTGTVSGDREQAGQAKAEAQPHAEERDKVEAKASPEANAQAKLQEEQKAAARVEKSKVAAHARVAMLTIAFALGGYWIWRKHHKRLAKFIKPTCKQCGAIYAIWTTPWTAQLGAGICSRCCEAERATALEAEKTRRAEEAAKQSEQSAGSLHRPVAGQDGVFYYRVKGEEKGPYTFKQLTSMWESGQLTADALYRTSDSSEWIPLLQCFSEPTSLIKPTNEPVSNQQEKAGTQNRFSSGMGWRKKVAVVGGVALAVICGVAFLNSGANSGGRASGSSSPSNRSQKSDRQLIKDYASSHYAKIESIDIDSYTDGSYQVKIYAASGYQGMGYKTSTYKVGVNSSAQEVTSWQYVGE